MNLAVLLVWIAGFALQGGTVNVADFGARADGRTDFVVSRRGA
ncbi:MAG: hypothetical protein ACK41F_09275 [Fimbriimonadaceae bacterium]